MLGGRRMLVGLAREGLLPSRLGRVHARSHAPHVGILCHAAIAMVLALTGTFAELAVLSTLAVAPLYLGGSVAAWCLARRGVAEAGAPLNFRWLGSAVMVAAVSMLVLIALASRPEITGLVVVITASVLGYLLLRWKAAP